MPNAIRPKRVHVILNVTHACNLACRYCYYGREMARHPGQMGLDTVERVFESVARSSATAVDVSLHGGEPLLHKPSYFSDLFTLQRRCLRDRAVHNSIQTNGTRIDEAFIDAYKAIVGDGTHLGLGVSLDGPQAIHDAARRYRRDGGGSYSDVMRGISLLHRHGIEIAILAVAPLAWPGCGRDLYEFFKSLPNVHFLDLLVPSTESFPEAQDGSLARIYTGLFDAWFFDRAAAFDIRFFRSVIEALLTGRGSLCTFQYDCVINNMMLSIVPNGDVSFCDSFPDMKLGNIWTDSVDDLTLRTHRERTRFSLLETRRTEACLFCRWFGVCHGGCPATYVPGSGRPHHFCADYQQIFAHVQGRLLDVGVARSRNLRAENLDRLINPRLADHLRKLRDENMAPTAESPRPTGGNAVMSAVPCRP